MTRARTAVTAALILTAAACAEPLAPPVESAGAVAAGERSANAPASGYRYEGCGTEFGTCAEVVLTAEQVDEGMWRLRGYIENESFRAKRTHRNSMILFVAVDGGFANLWDGYREFDCGGCNFQAGTAGPSVIFASFTGVFDDRCERNRPCRDLKMESFVDTGPASLPYAFPVEVEFSYLDGRVYFDQIVFMAEWTPETSVQVSQYFVGGSAAADFYGGIETYELDQKGRAPLRLPTNLIAQAPLHRSAAEARLHVQRAARGLSLAYGSMTRIAH